jgi:DNA (cytosine-5)-methyltransferase 1
MNYGSVCSGVEAASLAWEHLGWQAKFFAEVEPFPAAVLMNRFGATRPLRPLDPAEANGAKDRKLRESWQRQIAAMPEGGTIPNLGDFTKIRNDDYDGNIDLLVGGCPCQSYSLAGLRKGLADPRGNLSLEFVRLAYRSNARWLVFENVPGLLSSGDKGSDFAGFLSLLCGWEVKPPKDGWRKSGIVTPAPGCFGVAWRILDAQYTRVPEFPRAVPQRRRRLILVGHLDSWLYPAQVLFDGEMRGGHTPPRRTKRQDAAAGAEAGAGADGCFDIRRNSELESGIAPTLQATDYKGGKAICYENHGQDSRVREIEIAPVLSAKSGTGGNNLPLVQEVFSFDSLGSNSMKSSNPNSGCRKVDVAKTLDCAVPEPSKNQGGMAVLGFIKNDAGGEQQGFWTDVFPTVRSQATPAVAVAGDGEAPYPESRIHACYPLNSMIFGKESKDGDRQTLGIGDEGDPCPTLQANHHHAVAVAENIIGRKVENGGNGVGAQEELCYTLNATGVHGVAQNASVRRLLPVECERLMGFPDNHTRITWKGKPAEECPDAPRYKACGNSMCVNVMLWIGQRIEQVETTI